MEIKRIPKEDSEGLSKTLTQIVICQRQIENKMDDIIKKYFIQEGKQDHFDYLLNKINFMNKVQIVMCISKMYNIKIDQKPFENCNTTRNIYLHKPYYYDMEKEQIVIVSGENANKVKNIDYMASVVNAQKELDKINKKLKITTFKEIFNK